MNIELLALFQNLCVLTSGLFTGAAIYVSFVDHPSRMELGVKHVSEVFPGSYHRGAIMQLTLAILCLLFSIMTYFLSLELKWLYGGLVLFTVVPFTLIVLMPINKKLLDLKLVISPLEKEKLFIKWGKLHGVRSILSLVSFIIFLNNLRPMIN